MQKTMRKISCAALFAASAIFGSHLTALQPEINHSTAPEILACYYPSEYNNVYYPARFHKIFSFEAFGNEVELNNGSVWKIRSSDAYIVRETWKTSDYLTISPSYAPKLTGHSFYLTNQRNKTYVYATLQLGPVLRGYEDGKYTTEIIYIDPVHGDVTLEDGFGITYTFQVPDHLRFGLKQWKIGQNVIIGSNDNWLVNFWDSADCILINVERNKYIKAKQY
jgi:hypothetical protein